MEKVIRGNGVPIKIWTDSVEDGALIQACNVSELPFVVKHVALMPDVHQGYGVPIGTVFATDKVIIPNAVGKDIGCGVLAVKTDIIKSRDFPSTEKIKSLFSLIRNDVPVGFKWHEEAVSEAQNLASPVGEITREQHEPMQKQLGTLGGGNHFIEIQSDQDGSICFMVHSGSRNLGSKVADHYDKVARYHNARWHTKVPEKNELAFLPIDSEEGKAYFAEMKYCVDFAKMNREIIMSKVLAAAAAIIGIPIVELDRIDVAHNYARFEHHFGKNVIVHRKGATSARSEERGIIPGSQGANSYIVKGLGNVDSFTSCSHGAGRRMGRNQARKTLDLTVEKEKLDSRGIVHSVDAVGDLDEAEGAYKDITSVMSFQQDLVESIIVFSPLGVIKG